MDSSVSKSLRFRGSKTQSSVDARCKLSRSYAFLKQKCISVDVESVMGKPIIGLIIGGVPF